MAKSMPLSSTSAICAGKTALSRTHRPLSKRHHQHRRLALKAVQTPRKPAETVAPASNEDEKEAYPFEKQYKDCACVRFAPREPISIRFDEGDQSVSSKAIQDRDHIFYETLNYMTFFLVLSSRFSLSLSLSLSFRTKLTRPRSHFYTTRRPNRVRVCPGTRLRKPGMGDGN